MDKKKIIKGIAILIVLSSLTMTIYVFRNIIVSFVTMYIIETPYICSKTKEEAQKKETYLCDYRVSKFFLHNEELENVILISDTPFVEKRHMLSYRKLKGIEIMDDSYTLVIPCHYANDYYSQLYSTWDLKTPFSAHPNFIKARFEKGTANQYTFPPDTISLYLINSQRNAYIDSVKLTRIIE